MSNKKVTVLDVQKAKQEGRKLVMLTAYDYPLGLMAAEAGVDIVLVGDSLGMAVQYLELEFCDSAQKLTLQRHLCVQGYINTSWERLSSRDNPSHQNAALLGT